MPTKCEDDGEQSRRGLTSTLFVKGVFWTSPSVACSILSPIYRYYGQKLACKLITEFKFSPASMILPL
jgi:hypothetical protein